MSSRARGGLGAAVAALMAAGAAVRLGRACPSF